MTYRERRGAVGGAWLVGVLLLGCGGGGGGGGDQPASYAVLDLSNACTWRNTFGRTTDEIQRYETFVADDHPDVVGVAVKIRKWNMNPYEFATVELRDTAADHTPATLLASSAIDTNSLGTTAAVVTAPLTYQGLVAGKEYAIVLAQPDGTDFNTSGYEWCVTPATEPNHFGKWNGTSWMEEPWNGWLKVSVRKGSAGGWVSKRTMLGPRFVMSAAVLSGQIFVPGGQGTVGTVSTVEAYDPSTNSWTTEPSLATLKGPMGVTTLGDEIFAIYASTEIFDGTAWSAGPALPVAPAGSWLHAVTVGGKIYAVSEAGPVHVYDPSSGWAAETSIPLTRVVPAVGAVGDSIYVIGGYDPATYGTLDMLPLPAVQRYDTVAQEWADPPPASMPTARDCASVAVLDGKIYVIGGRRVIGSVMENAMDTVEVYDPATDTWAVMPPLPAPLAMGAAAATGGSIYAIGGHDAEFSPLDSVFAYRP